MADMRTYSGSCHCGRVRYEVATALSPVLSCNCSICQKRGYMLTFVPRSAFELISGENDLTDYQFNRKVIHHLFARRAVSALSVQARDRTRRRWSR